MMTTFLESLKALHLVAEDRNYYLNPGHSFDLNSGEIRSADAQQETVKEIVRLAKAEDRGTYNALCTLVAKRTELAMLEAHNVNTLVWHRSYHVTPYRGQLDTKTEWITLAEYAGETLE
jgi:hypothetical protein